MTGLHLGCHYFLSRVGSRSRRYLYLLVFKYQFCTKCSLINIQALTSALQTFTIVLYYDHQSKCLTLCVGYWYG